VEIGNDLAERLADLVESPAGCPCTCWRSPARPSSPRRGQAGVGLELLRRRVELAGRVEARCHSQADAAPMAPLSPALIFEERLLLIDAPTVSADRSASASNDPVSSLIRASAKMSRGRTS